MNDRALAALAALAAFATLALPGTSSAAPLNPWGAVTPADHFAFTPFVYVQSDGAVSPLLFGWFGAADVVDVMVGAGFDLHPSGDPAPAEMGDLQLMVRYFPHDNVGIALHTFYTPGSDTAVLGPEVHAFGGTDRFGVVFNTGWYPVISPGDGFDPGDWFAIVAPEVYVNDWFSVFVEINPTVALADPELALTLVPGVSFSLDKDKKHAMALGVQLPVAPTFGGASFGITYGTTFDMKKGRRTRISETLAAPRDGAATATSALE